MRKIYLLLFFAAMSQTALAAQNDADSLRTEEAKKAYQNYLQQLKELNAQYKQITAEMKKLLKDEEIPSWDEEKDEKEESKPSSQS